MDKILKDLFGGDDEPAVAVGAAASPETDSTAKAVDPDREARRKARRQRKADPDHKRKRDDFVERYTTGDPSEGFTADEAIEHLREMREEMTPAEFRAAMQRTLENLPPSQRDDFIAIMSQYQGGQQGNSSHGCHRRRISSPWRHWRSVRQSAEWVNGRRHGGGGQRWIRRRD